MKLSPFVSQLESHFIAVSLDMSGMCGVGETKLLFRYLLQVLRYLLRSLIEHESCHKRSQQVSGMQMYKPAEFIYGFFANSRCIIAIGFVPIPYLLLALAFLVDFRFMIYDALWYHMYINCTQHLNVFLSAIFWDVPNNEGHTPYEDHMGFAHFFSGPGQDICHLLLAWNLQMFPTVWLPSPRPGHGRCVSTGFPAVDRSGATRWMDSDLALHGLVRSLSWSRWGLGGHGNGNHVLFGKSAAKGVLSKELVPYMIFEWNGCPPTLVLVFDSFL